MKKNQSLLKGIDSKDKKVLKGKRNGKMLKIVDTRKNLERDNR